MLGFVRGGGEIWDLKMANRIESQGVDVTFVTGSPLRDDSPYAIEDFDTETVTTPHIIDFAYSLPPGAAGVMTDLDAFFFARKVGKVLGDINPDLLHVNTWPHLAGVADAFDGPTVIKLNGPPHSLWYDVVNPFTSSYQKLNLFDAIVTTGVTTDEVAKRTDSDPVEINPGVNTKWFTPSSGTEEIGSFDTGPGDKPLDLLFVGRFVRTKNLPRLINAVAGLPDNIIGQLMLVGDGPRRELIHRHVADTGVADLVTFEGYVENDELPKYYRKSDIVVLSSRRENYPITLLESMSCGTPVVAPDVGAINRIVTDGEDGLIYEPGSVEELQECLLQFHDEPELRVEMGKRARQRALDFFDWADRARRLKALYTDLLEGR